MPGPVVAAAGSAAAKGARKTARKARENPGGALLVGAVALLALSQLRGAIPKLPPLGAVIPDQIEIAAKRFRDMIDPGDLRMPGEDIQVAQVNIGDFVAGIFSQDDYMAEDEGPVPPVLVPRPFPTNPAAGAGQRFGDWLFQGPGYDVRDLWD